MKIKSNLLPLDGNAHLISLKRKNTKSSFKKSWHDNLYYPGKNVVYDDVWTYLLVHRTKVKHVFVKVKQNRSYLNLSCFC